MTQNSSLILYDGEDSEVRPINNSEILISNLKSDDTSIELVNENDLASSVTQKT